MVRPLLRLRRLPFYLQIRNQETSTKIKSIESVPPATTASLHSTDVGTVLGESTIQIKTPSLNEIRVKEVDAATQTDSSLKLIQNFDEVPGPRVLKNVANILRYIPSLSTHVTATTIQYILSTGSQLVGGADSRFIKWLFDEYGPVVRLEAPLGGNIVILSRPEHVHAVFKNEGPYPIRSSLDCIEKYRLQYRKYKQAGPYIMHGPEWIQLRSKIQTPLESMLDIHFQNLQSSCDRFVKIIKKIRNQQEETPAEFHSEIYKWSMDCLTIVSFNKELGFLDAGGLRPTSEAMALFNALKDATAAIHKCEGGLKLWKFFVTRDWKLLLKQLDTIDNIVNKYIGSIQLAIEDKDSKLSIGPNSLVEALLVKEQLQPEDILTVLVDLMIIGVNTTSHAMAFLLYHLARNPKVQKKLYNEIRNANLYEINSYEKLPYLQACIKESLRLKPPMPVLSRILQQDVIIHNYRIPKDTFVLMATHLASLRDENFENPTKYDPERWIDDTDSGTQSLASIPFGFGPKSCLGQKLAMLQLSMMTAKIIKEFNIQYNYGDITAGTKILSNPNRPLKFRFIERN
uniref:Cytochrome P450 CYP334Q1 n=1 Tax=Chrysoperla zastrowi sillemi TaxID=482137 RepID=A0A9E8BW72_9NEOP|nr:cytochrome P450 CYP334Q1 [Chrysoperla zastrowi sillemi]